MKNKFTVIGVILIVFALGMYLMQEDASQEGAVNSQTFAFSCPDDYQFTITYTGENNDEATLELPTESHDLTRVRSASGARYATADESVVFWEHQGEAMIEIDGETIRENCVISRN